MYSFDLRALARARVDADSTQEGSEQVPVVVYWIGLSSLLADISAESVASVLPVFLFSTLQLSALQVGFMDGLYQGGAAVVTVVAAFLADKHRTAKGVAFLGYALSALSRIGFILSGSLGLLFAMGSLCVDRVGKGIRTAPRDALIAGHSPKSIVGSAFGVHRSMDAVGALIGPLLSAGVLFLLPFRFDWLFSISLCFALAGLAVFRLKVTTPLSMQSQDRKKAGGRSEDQHSLSIRTAAKILFEDKRYVGLAALAAFLSMFTVSDGLIYVSMQRSAGFDPSYVPLMFAFTAVFFFVAAIPMGRLADRIGPIVVFLLGYAVLAFTYLWLAFLPSDSGISATLIVALLGVHYGATDGVLAASAVRTLEPMGRTTGLALLTTAIGLTRICSSVLYGWLWQQTSQEFAIRIFAIGMTLCLATAIYVLRKLRTA